VGNISGVSLAQDSATTEQAVTEAKEAIADVKEDSAEASQAATEAKQQSTELQKQLDEQAALLDQQKAASTGTAASIAELQRQINAQSKTIDQQQKYLAEQQTTILNQQQQLGTQSDVLTNMQSQVDQINSDQGTQLSDAEIAMRARLAKLETQVSQIPEDPSTMLADDSFPGAIRVPGTTASYKIGGFVKASLVKNFDPLLTQDRFIPGTIPVTANDQKALASETSLTANQTRVNFDYRQRNELGTVRAFVEGDFAGAGDTFRLRHAFGQFKDLLAGKTWSAFYDAEAAPEEVDFEGINGRVVVRQTQVRYFPQIGKDLRWMISLEDPQPQVAGATGVSDVPDLVSSIRRDWFNRWHVKTAFLLRQIRASNNAGIDTNGQSCEPEDTDNNGVPDAPPGDSDTNGCVTIANQGSTNKKFGYAITASGKVGVPFWHKDDNFLFQLNFGNGLGRYLTDLNSVFDLEIDGGQDAVIDAETGEMKVLVAFGGYIAYQHWWKKRLRSTVTISSVLVDNEDSQPTYAYKSTDRVSVNLLWSPTKNVDLGGEFLWGRRTNKDKEKADATQLQMTAIYRF
jgi:hypothetical protein